jgi:hypothetical protein
MASLKYRVDFEETTEFGQTLGFAKWCGGPTLSRVKEAICKDGKKRIAYVTGDPLTYFSLPARVNVGKKSIRGSLYLDDGVYHFTPWDE